MSRDNCGCVPNRGTRGWPLEKGALHVLANLSVVGDGSCANNIFFLIIYTIHVSTCELNSEFGYNKFSQLSD